MQPISTQCQQVSRTCRGEPVTGKGCAYPPKCRQNVQLYLAFLRSTTPIPGKGCSCPPKCRQNVQLYLAFLRSTTPISGKGCACPPKCRQTVQLYLAFLHSTTPIPGKGCACPPKCRQNEQPLPALLILTTRIPGKGCSCPPKFVSLRRVQSLDHANPCEGLRVAPKSWKKLQFYLAFVRSTTPIPGKGCACPPKCRQN